MQGVGFRAFVEREARRVGLDGWVRNRRDGGGRGGIRGRRPTPSQDMIAACRRGPRASLVQRVELLDGASEPASGFHVLPTI